MAILNLSYYTGDDKYSDGSFTEKRILDYIKQNKNHDFSNLFLQDPDLAVFTNLSDCRESLLSWYDFDPEAEVLEVGSGMGALTGMLCEKCRSITSVEFSKTRAEAILERNRDRENLSIIVGDFNTINFDKQFDYIVVVGVLEHQTAFSDAKNAQLCFLENLRNLLLPTGKLLLAIENRLGLKYWCGEIDEHSGIPFGSINDFRFGGKAHTLDRASLINMLDAAGLKYRKFYYPLPDYRFPRAIYSENYLPSLDISASVQPMYYSRYYGFQSPVVDERSLYGSIIQNGVFEFMANSFLVECAANSVPMSTIDYAAVSIERNPKYRTCVILRNGKFVKTATCNEGKAHLRKTYDNSLELDRKGLSIIPQEYENDEIIMPFQKTATLEDMFISALRSGDSEKGFSILDILWNLIQKTADPVSPDKNVMLSYSIAGHPISDEEWGIISSKVFCDMTLSNIFASDGDYLLFDQEWTVENAPVSYAMFRAVAVLYSSHPWLEDIIPKEVLSDRYHLSSLWNCFSAFQREQFSDVQNDGICGRLGFLRELPENTISDNIDLLRFGKHKTEEKDLEINSLKAVNEYMNSKIAAYEKIINEKDLQINGRDEIIKEKDLQIAGRDEIINEKDMQIAGRDEIIEEKDLQIAGREEIIREKDFQIAGREEIIREKDFQIDGREQVIAMKEKEIEQLRMLDIIV